LRSEEVIASTFWSLDTQHKVLKGQDPTIDVGDLESVVGLELAEQILDGLGVESINYETFQELMNRIAKQRRTVRREDEPGSPLGSPRVPNGRSREIV